MEPADLLRKIADTFDGLHSLTWSRVQARRLLMVNHASTTISKWCDGPAGDK